MPPAIDSMLIFALSFVSFFIAYKQVSKPTIEDDGKSQKLEARIKSLSKQQDELLETANNHISTFMQVEMKEFGQDFESGQQLLDRIKLIMKKSGITEISVNAFIAICCGGGAMLSAGIVHFKFLNALTGIPIGMCVGSYLAYTLLASQAEKKKTEFLKQFPDAIDMMIRGVKAGLNIARIVKLVSMEAKDPIASEYRIISQKFDLGIEPEKVLLEAADKIDIEEFRFLVVALILQMENGGVLAEILQNLSSIIRKRLELNLKLKAMSAEARMSAIVISVLPFVFAGIMAVINPNHLKEFVTPGTGQTLLKVAVTLFSIGTFMMIKATKIKV
ncbi:MAG: type II secretion system F family protein [Holosporaceae bacterium]|jgi:tight adherence protein B|nr:type II secretion system F family protein [Holosporaceae bacterium]